MEDSSKVKINLIGKSLQSNGSDSVLSLLWPGFSLSVRGTKIPQAVWPMNK